MGWPDGIEERRHSLEFPQAFDIRLEFAHDAEHEDASILYGVPRDEHSVFLIEDRDASGRMSWRGYDPQLAVPKIDDLSILDGNEPSFPLLHIAVVDRLGGVHEEAIEFLIAADVVWIRMRVQ